MKQFLHTLVIFVIVISFILFSPEQKVQADISFDIGVNEEFLQPNIAAGGVSTLRIYFYNTNTFQVLLGTNPAALTYKLPDDLYFTDPVSITNTCGGLITYSGTTFSLFGGTIPQMSNGNQGTCNISIQLTSIKATTYYSHINSKSVTAKDPGGNAVTNSKGSADVSLTVSSVQPPSLSKIFNKNTIFTGETSTMSLRITNTDPNYSLTKVSVTDSIPTGITLSTTGFTSSNCGSPTVTQIDGTTLTTSSTGIKVNNATIAKSDTCVVNFTVTSLIPGIYLNSIPAGAVQTQQGVTNASAASAPLNVQNIMLSKSFSPSTVMVGGQSKLTITLQNGTKADYTDVSFTDNLPSGMTVVPGTLATTCSAGTVATNPPSNSTVAFSAGTITKSSTCTVTATVTIAVAGSYTNTIPAGGLKVGTTGITNILAATANLSSYGTGLGLTGSKSFSPSTIPVGGTSRLTINIRAPADVEKLNHVTVQDALPAGLAVASSPSMQISNCGTPTFSPLAGDTSLSFSNGTIQGNTTCTFSVMVVAAGTGSFTNVISPTNITDDEGRDISGTLSDTLIVSGLLVTKAFYPTAVNQGNISTLTIQLTNNNYDQLNAVNFTDLLPSGLVVADDGSTRKYVNTCGGTLTNSSGSPLGTNDTSIKLNNGTIPAQVGSVPGTCTINVDVKANKIGDKTNTIGAGKVTGTLQTSHVTITNPNGTSATLHVLDLSITINKNFSPVSVTGGGTSTLSVYLENPNNYPLVGIGFTDNLPQDGTGTSGMHIATAANTSTGSCGGTITATPGTNLFTFAGGYLDVNSHCTLTVDVVMDHDGNMTNTIGIGDVTSSNGASNPYAGVATLYNSPGAYVVKKFWNIDASAHTANMTITVTNKYTYQITGIKLTDSLPTGMTLTSADTSQCNGTVTTTTSSLSLTGGSLAANASCDVVASVQTGTAGSFENCIDDGAMTIDQKDSSGNAITNHGKACDTLTTTDAVLPPTVTKSFSPSSIPLGSSSDLSISISNPNAVALSNVAFSDTLPSGLTLTSIPNSTQCGGSVSWDSTSGILALSGGALAAKGSCTVVASVTGASSIVYPNSVTVTASSGTSNISTASLTVVAPPQITKVFNSGSILANGTSTLTFDILNPLSNSAALTGVGFVDSLPDGVKVAATPASSISTDCGSASFIPAANATTLTLSGAAIDVGKTCEVKVDVTATNGGTYVNTTQVVTSTNGGNGNKATATLNVSGPGLTLKKTTSTANYKALGDTITYAYTLTNTGNVILTSPFQVIDDHIGSPLSTPFDCGTATQLAANESTTCTASYAVTTNDIAAKAVKNMAYATASDGTNTVTSNTDSVTVNEAALTIAKTTSSVSYFTAGAQLSYSYMLTNTGNVTLYGSSADGKNLFTVSDDHIGTPTKKTPFDCGSVTQLAPGANVSCTAQYSVASADLDTAVTGITNKAFATGKDAGGLTVTSNNDSVTIPKVTTPLIAKSFDPAIIAVGQSSTMTITVYNTTWSSTNLVPLTGVNFSDTFPSGMTVVNTPDVNQCGGTVGWNGTTGTLSLSGGSVIGSSCTITALVTANAAKVYTNTTDTLKTSNSTDGGTATANLTVLQGGAITKSFTPSTVLQGQPSTLTLIITNPASNTKALEGVAFTDTLPAGMTVYSTPNVKMANCDSSAVFTPVSGDGTLSFGVDELPIGSTCTLTVDVIAPAAGKYLNTTSAITSTNGGTGATSNTATLNVLKSADLQITKADSVANVSRGDTVTYSITATNAGPSDATGATIVDNIPSNLSGAIWSCTGSGGATCTASGSGDISDTVNLPVNGSVTYTVSATVSASAIGSVVNTAVVTPPSDLSDTNPLNNIATDVDAFNLLSMTKSAIPTAYSVIGSSIAYTYTVTNSGTSTLKSPFNVYDDKLTPSCSTIPNTLLPGDSFTCTGTHVLTSADLDATSITNEAHATGIDSDGHLITSNKDTVTVTSNQNPLIGLSKEATKVKLVSVGTYDVTFTYTLKNYGNVTLHNLQATDNLVTAFPTSGISSFSVISVTSPNLVVNSAFDGNSHQNLLLSGNTLAAGESQTMQVVVRVIPLSHGQFYNSATVTGVSPINANVTDVSQNGTNPDSNNDGNPTNDNEPTPVDFGSKIFKPPLGVKKLDQSQMPVMKWNITWINNKNIVPMYNVVYDPIPISTTYIADFIDSGIAAPSGAPTGSTSAGVTCKASGKSITKLCYYEGPTSANPRGQVVWTGVLAPDFGITDPPLAANELKITFSTQFLQNTNHVGNTATIDSDLNGDGDTSDSGEQDVANANAAWDAEKIALPASGFTPGVVTQLPTQPKALAFSALNDLWIEIPSLSLQSTIIGVPASGNGWNISWLGQDTGWLNGTSFPTHAGNAVLTGHIFDANGLPGPFAKISQLKYGDQIIIHAWNQQYVYEVRDTKTILPDDTKDVLKHEVASWITLLTCRDYDAKSNTYLNRYIVRAVLTKVK